MGELAPVPGLEFPHSFLRLDDGELLATMQHGVGNTGELGRTARAYEVRGTAKILQLDKKAKEE